MPHPIFTVTVVDVKDLEAACRRMRQLGGDESGITLRGDFTRDVTVTLSEHESSGRFSISFDTFEA